MSIITKDGQQFALVNTTNGTEVPAGFAMITANLREVKGSSITADQKHRNVVIPEFTCPESVEKKFAPVLIDKFYSLAKDYLEVQMTESNRMLREIPLSAFSIDNLLSFFARVAVSSRLTSESVGAWFDSSATGKAIVAKVAAKTEDAAQRATMLKKYRDLFCKTASPNHGINPNTCTVLLTLLSEDDKESNVYETLANRWQATITKSQESEVDSL
jgi:hypothetical protein